MDWKKDTDFEVLLTYNAEMQVQKILDYIFYELGNAQAAQSVEQDIFTGLREYIEKLTGAFWDKSLIPQLKNLSGDDSLRFLTVLKHSSYAEIVI